MQDHDRPDINALRPWLVVDGPDQQGEWSGFCPLHEDQNASASYNFDKQVWRCFAGCPDGALGELLWRIEEEGGTTGTVTAKGDRGGFTADVVDIRTKRKREVPLPSLGSVAGWHSALMSNPDALAALQERRGLTQATIEAVKLGWDNDEGAYTIPFFEGGKLVNLKRYRLDLHDHDKKMWGVSGHNERRLYPAAPDTDEPVLLCEGEMDTLLARQYGFNAVTGSGGAKNWKPEWGVHFKDCKVYVCYDRDSTGREALKVVRHHLKEIAESVYDVQLPFKLVKKHGKDLTDLYHEVGAELFKQELDELMRGAKQISGKQETQDGAQDISVLDSMNIKLAGQALNMRAQVAARTGDTRSYPSSLTVGCFENKGDKCQFCPMSSKGERVGGRLEQEVAVAPGDDAILELVDPRANLAESMRKHLGLLCKDLTTEVHEYENCQMLGVRRAIDEEDESDSRVDKEDLTSIRRIMVSPEFTTMQNRTVQVKGKVVHNERTKVNEFLAWEVQDTETSLDRFRMTPELHERLKVFQPAEGQRPLKKCGEIAQDLAANVTHIVGRQNLHVAFDLVWHSVLRFRYDGKLLRKGWLEMMVAGDTRTGKSEVAERLAQHYRAGRVVSAETATRSGLLGGSQRVNDEWSVTWGIIPLSDRRLVVIDEVSGLSHEDIGQMSSVRSSGVAEVRQITSDSVPARTRLIWMGNPRSGRSMREVGDGVDVVQELLGAPEDIARLDFAMSVRSDEVSMNAINATGERHVAHRFTRDLCHDLVMWAWSRKPHQVLWQRGAEREAKAQAVKMGHRYTEQPPLVQAANMREKIARMAVAIAARTYSTDDGTNVVVTRQHVKDAVRFLDHLYGNRGFGYRDRSRQAKGREKLAQDNRIPVMNDLLGDAQLERFFRDMPGVVFLPQTMESDMNLRKEDVNAKISKYRQMGMLMADTMAGRTAYRLSPELIELLKDMREQ